MTRVLIVAILLAFPFAEIYLLIQLGQNYGWWLLIYLVVIGFLGLQLIRGEKLLVFNKMMQSVIAGANPVKSLLGSARNMLAGVLLIIPGVITDLIAVSLLIVPIRNIGKLNTQSATNINDSIKQAPFQTGYKHKPNTKAANDDIIEGEYTEVKTEVKIEEKPELK